MRKEKDIQTSLDKSVHFYQLAEFSFFYNREERKRNVTKSQGCPHCLLFFDFGCLRPFFDIGGSTPNIEKNKSVFFFFTSFFASRRTKGVTFPRRGQRG